MSDYISILETYAKHHIHVSKHSETIMKKSAVVEHLDAALVLARYEGMTFLAYLIAMAKTAAEQTKRRSA